MAIRAALLATVLTAALASSPAWALVDSQGNQTVNLKASSLPLLGTPETPNVVSPLSGSLTNASTPSLGATSVAGLSACGVTPAPGAPPTGCANGTGRVYIRIGNQNDLTANPNALVCYSFGAPASCVPGSGSYILRPGRSDELAGSNIPPDQLNWTCSAEPCAGLLWAR